MEGRCRDAPPFPVPRVCTDMALADIDLDFPNSLFAWATNDGPGAALGIYRDGQPLLLRGFGLANVEHGVPITPDTVFHVASLSKQVTAFCFALLAERGMLDVDQPLGALFPEIPVIGPITPRQILHHCSGLRDQWGLLDLAGWRHEDVKRDADILGLCGGQRALNFATGTRFQYINSGYTILAAAIERVTGMSLRAFAHDALFAPLGMHRTCFRDAFDLPLRGRADAYACAADGTLRINNPAYATAGPTGLFTTVADFAAWEQHLLQPRLCSQALIAAMHRPGPLLDGQSTGYGFGLAIGRYRGLEVAEHAGGDAAFRAHYLRFPAQRLAIAIFCNTAIAPPGQIARKMADHLLAAAFDAAANRAVAPAQASRAVGAEMPAGDALLAYCGSYREPGGHDRVEVRYRDGRLFLCPPGGPDYELASTGPATFAFLGLDATCEFLVEPGAPTRFRTFYGGTQTASLEAVPPEAVGPRAPASDYLGIYDSAELDVAYRVAMHGGALVLDRGRRGAHPLVALAHDEFACAGGLSIRFERDAAGAVAAMLVSTERVWDLRFERRATPCVDQDKAMAGHAGPSTGAPSR